MLVGDAEPLRKLANDSLRLIRTVAVVGALVRDEREVPPGRLAIPPPVAAERPPRQLLAWIPLALTEMDEAIRAEMPPQPLH